MAKTRRKKIRQSPAHPFGGHNSRAKVFIAEQGDRITTKGIRGRTVVNRVTNEQGKRLTSVRITQDEKQTPAKPVGERKPKVIWVGRRYTGVARGKEYPYRSTKRGAPEQKPEGLMGRLASAVKRVVVK